MDYFALRKRKLPPASFWRLRHMAYTGAWLHLCAGAHVCENEIGVAVAMTLLMKEMTSDGNSVPKSLPSYQPVNLTADAVYNREGKHFILTCGFLWKPVVFALSLPVLWNPMKRCGIAEYKHGKHEVSVRKTAALGDIAGPKPLANRSQSR